MEDLSAGLRGACINEKKRKQKAKQKLELSQGDFNVGGIMA